MCSSTGWRRCSTLKPVLKCGVGFSLPVRQRLAAQSQGGMLVTNEQDICPRVWTFFLMSSTENRAFAISRREI